MKTLEEFKAYYAGGLAPELEAAEARRKGALKGIAVLTVVAAALMGFSVLYQLYGRGLVSDGLLDLALGFLPFVLGVVVWVLGYLHLRGNYVRDYKSGVMGSVIKFIDEGLEFSPKRFVQESAFVQSKIFERKPDRYSGEDCVFGMVGKTAVEFSEVFAEYKIESKDRRGNRQESWETIFKGIFFVADFNKEFKGLTLVLPDTAERLFGGMIGQFLQAHNRERPPLVKLEDPDFEKLFVVYADDQIEARYILSPSLMERLTGYRRKTKREIFFSFVDDKVMMAIPYEEELFEPSLLRTVKDFREMEGHFENLGLIVGTVEDLSLNTRIWGKD